MPWLDHHGLRKPNPLLGLGNGVCEQRRLACRQHVQGAVVCAPARSPAAHREHFTQAATAVAATHAAAAVLVSVLVQLQQHGRLRRVLVMHGLVVLMPARHACHRQGGGVGAALGGAVAGTGVNEPACA